MLDDGDGGEILLPNREVPDAWTEGEPLEVFIYRDSEDRITATLRKPLATVGEFALLQVKDSTSIGAFLDWGLPKDLLVPFREQRIPMKPGHSYLVHVYLDRVSGRIVASAKLDKFLDSRRFFNPGEKVNLMIWQQTDLGYKAIIEHECWGMIFHNDVFSSRFSAVSSWKDLLRGSVLMDALILCCSNPGYGKVPGIADQIMEKLKDAGGFLPLTNKTSPEEINALFSVSKKAYKQAVGALYRKRLIVVEDDGIRLV